MRWRTCTFARSGRREGLNTEMTRSVSELLEKALSLQPEERAALAGSLLESLDDHVDANAEEEWNLEIPRRIQELDSGKVKTIPWAEARRQVLSRLPSWSEYLTDGPVASADFMENLEDLPAPRRNRQG
jgi:putative addiction module component (TIGR02574 family)